MSDYMRLDVHGIKGRSFRSSIQEKGLKEELAAFADGIENGVWPIPWWQQMQTARVGLLVQEQITSCQQVT